MKTALVTGCSSGIGYSVAKELAKRGWKVFACARRLEPMNSLIEEYPDLIEIFSLDVTSPESIKKAYELVSSKLEDGKLDLLYNNAGSSCTFPAIDVPDEALTMCLNTNVAGPIRMTHTFSRLVIAAHGTIAFTGSLAGVMPFPWSSVYGGSKSMIHQYASILGFEMQPFDVRVINFITGAVDTNIADTRPLPMDSIYNIPETQESLAYRREMAVKNRPEDPADYAREVVDEIEHGWKGRLHVYVGGGASMYTWIANHIPRCLILWGERIKFKLNPVWDALATTYSKSKQA